MKNINTFFLILLYINTILVTAQNIALKSNVANAFKVSAKADTIFKRKAIYREEKGAEFCKLIREINENDQVYRMKASKEGGLTNKINLAIDSIYNSIGMSAFTDGSGRPVGANLSKKEQLVIGNLASKIVCEKYPDLLLKYKNNSNSIDVMQITEDNHNTELLIDIIQKRGYPNKNNCNCLESNLKKLIVFRHSQTKYFNKIRVLIEKEYKAKRLPEKKYKLFLDHINGRTGKDL